MEIKTANVNGIEWKYTVSDGKATLAKHGDIEETFGEIVIPSELDGFPVTSIGVSAFEGCSSLTGVTMPDSVTSIGEGAFSYCGSLVSFTVAEDNPNYKSVNGLLLSKDGTRLIAGVNGDVVIPEGVTRIGDSAFCCCSSLTSVAIPESVTSIGYSAFVGCRSLKSVTMPASVTSIGEGAFGGCESLTSFKVAVDNPNYKSVNGLLLSKDGTRLIAGVNGDVVIPEGMTSIGDLAFGWCGSLTSVTIPESVTSIGCGAFSGCRSLTSVTIPESVTYIGWEAFGICRSLKTVFVAPGDAERVKSLGEFPDGVQFVEKKA